MAVDLHMVKTARGLVPAEPQDADAFDEMEFGVVYKIHGTRPRSSKRNRWFHACLRTLFDMQETWPTPTLFKQAIKRALGLFDVYEVSGVHYFEYPSIAFHKMNEEDFKTLCDRFVKLICERIVPVLDEDEARRVFDVLDGNKPPVVNPRTGEIAQPKHKAA